MEGSTCTRWGRVLRGRVLILPVSVSVLSCSVFKFNCAVLFPGILRVAAASVLHTLGLLSG